MDKCVVELPAHYFEIGAFINLDNLPYGEYKTWEHESVLGCGANILVWKDFQVDSHV